MVFGLLLRDLGSNSGVDSSAALAMAESNNLDNALPGSTDPLDAAWLDTCDDFSLFDPSSLNTCIMDGSPNNGFEVVWSDDILQKYYALILGTIAISE